MPYWLNVSFESSINDDCPDLKCEYDGLRLFVKSTDYGYGDVIAAYINGDSSWKPTLLKINRFLSAMAWRDRKAYRTLGAGGGHTTSEKKNLPEFFLFLPRQSRPPARGLYCFDNLQNPPTKEQKLSLALYREALNEINPLYRFLSFYKIVNLRLRTGREQILWVNSNISNLFDPAGDLSLRVQRIRKKTADVGEYLCHHGRNAIAHASLDQTSRDPDEMEDKDITDENLIMQALAEFFIMRELQVPR